ncbi:MAG TPA: glycosyl transferase, partial [Verrucomicrobiales bacterium]|nr:glycosyl transferase [Verrucomicrobiales bacterium]
MPPPPLSVVMPVRNAGATVDRAVHSVLASTFADFEFIIVDDGSIDTSAAVVEALGDPRIRLFRRPAEGIVAALNFGLAQCRGEHIARMDADDFSYP